MENLNLKGFTFLQRLHAKDQKERLCSMNVHVLHPSKVGSFKKIHTQMKLIND
jgi:hypothetical protein